MRDPGADDNGPIYIADSDDEEPALVVHSQKNTSTSTLPLNNVLGDGSPGPSSEQSPLVVQQGQSRGRAGQSVRQLDYEGLMIDVETTLKRQRYLEATGKAPAVEQEVKEESSDPLQREVQQEDLDQLLLDIEQVPQLFDQLTNGEGSSSNPRHIWRQRVFAVLQQQQEGMALSSQSQQNHSKRPRQIDSDDDDGAVIEDSQDEDDEQPAKRQRTMPSAGGDAGAGSSKQPAGRRNQQQQQAQQQQEEPGDEQPVPAVRAPNTQQGRSQQQKRTGLPPAARPPRQQQPSISNNAVGTAAAAAAAGGGSSGVVSRPTGSARSARDEQREKQREKVERRVLRAKLTRIQADAAANRPQLLDSSTGELASRLFKLTELGAQATCVREAAQHAGVLSQLSKDAVDMIHNFHNERRGRNPTSLVSALTTRFPANSAAIAAAVQGGPVQLDWAALGAATAHMFRTGPGVCSMLGALSGAAKARRVAVRQARAAPEPEVRPVEGDGALRAEHGLGQETERVVTDMRRVLEREGRCGVIRLVLDHDSFAHTLENVFALSFLCKDMFVSLHEDQEKGVMVQHVTREQREQLTRQQEAGAGGKLLPHQFMMQLDMGLWEDMCAVVPRLDTLMPQRHSSH